MHCHETTFTIRKLSSTIYGEIQLIDVFMRKDQTYSLKHNKTEKVHMYIYSRNRGNIMMRLGRRFPGEILSELFLQGVLLVEKPKYIPYGHFFLA